MPYKDPAARMANARKYREKNRDKINQFLREWKKRNPDKVKNHKQGPSDEAIRARKKRYQETYKKDGRQNACRLKHRYGILVDEVEMAFSEQHGMCPICEQPLPARGFDIDHCHETGVFRGLLHRNCNLLLGMSKDNVEVLTNAIKYIQAGKKKAASRTGKKRSG